MIPQNIAREQAERNKKTPSNMIWECAMKLRQDILSIKPVPLEEPLTVEKIMQGEADTLESLKQFFTILYTWESSEVSRRKQR